MTYHYQQGRVERIEDSALGDEWINGVTYNTNGTWATITHDSGVTDVQVIDPNSMRRPGELKTTGASPADWSTGPYSYDGSGNVTAMGSDTFAYDEVSRVVESLVSGDRQDYAFDPYGNITQITTTEAGGSPEVRNLDPSASTNRLTGVGILYDDRGNLRSWGAQECHDYDEFNMVKQVRSGSCTGPVDRAYAYTADDERFLVVGGENKSEFTMRDLEGRLLRKFIWDLNEVWSVSLDNIWMEGRLVGFVEDGEEVHAHLDHLGTPRLHTDFEGTVRSEHDYFPFGEEVSDPGQDEIPMKFTGHERDGSALGTAAELDYMHARYYSPHWGRFTSVDPLSSSMAGHSAVGLRPGEIAETAASGPPDRLSRPLCTSRCVASPNSCLQ